MGGEDFNKPKVSPDVLKKLSDSPDATLDKNKDIRESLGVVLTKDGLKNKETISDGKVTKSQDSDHKENAPIQKPAEPAVKAPEKSRETILGDKNAQDKVQSGQGAAEKAQADVSRDVREDDVKKLDSSKPDYSG